MIPGSDEILQKVRTIQTPLSDSLSWPELLHRVGQGVLSLTGAEAVWLCVVDDEQGAMFSGGIVPCPNLQQPEDWVSLFDEDWDLNSSRIDPQQGLLWRAYHDQQARFAPDLALDDCGLDKGMADAFFNSLQLPVAAILPLQMDGQPLGVMAVAGPANLFADQATRSTTLVAAEQVAVSIQQARLLQASVRQARELEALNRIGRTITSSLELEEVIERTMAGINEILDVEAGSLLLLDEEAGELYFKITLRGENKAVCSFRLKLGQGVAGWVAFHNQPTLVLNVHADPRFFPSIDEAIGFHTRSVLCVPLVVHGKPMGAVELLNKRHGQFTAGDLDLLISMAASLAVAIENAALFAESQAHMRRASVINDIAAALNAILSPKEVAREVATQTSRLLPHDHASLALWEDSSQRFRIYVMNAGGEVQVKSKVELPPDRCGPGRVLQHGQASLIPDLATQADFEAATLLAEGIRCLMMVPLVAKGKIRGTLNLGSRQPGFYGLGELETLKEIAVQVAVAMENSRLFALMEQRTADLLLLNRMGEMLSSTLDMERILRTTLTALPRLVAGDIHTILLTDGREVWLGLETPYAADDSFLEAMGDRVGEIYRGLTEREVKKAKAEVCIRGGLPFPPGEEIRSQLTMPILTRDGPAGVVYVGSFQPAAFDDAALRVFSLIVSQISAAVENTRLFREAERGRAKLAAVLGSTAEVILVIGKEGQVLLANPSARSAFGFDVEGEATERLLSEAIDNRQVLSLFAQASREGMVTGEIPLQDGRTLHASVAPIGSEQDLVGWVAVMQDVTHFKELDQMKTDFVATVSHDLRSPLAGVLLAAEMVKRIGPVSPKQGEFLETIIRNVKDMSELIDELLDVGRIESGIGMEMGLCSLRPILLEVVDNLQEQAREKELQLELSLPPHLELVLGNEQRLKQVVANLVSNAIKYTLAGGHILVRAEDSGPEVLVMVRDTGIGVPPAHQPYLFDKFYRVRDEAVNAKGTGLGLAIVKSIMERHKGRVWLESEVGKGSTFYFTLPKADKGAEDATRF
jgi:PAS domain S-box-containing protein